MIIGITIALAQDRYKEENKFQDEIRASVYAVKAEAWRELGAANTRLSLWTAKRSSLTDIDRELQQWPPYPLITFEHLVKSDNFSKLETDPIILSEIYTIYNELNYCAYAATHAETAEQRLQSYINYAGRLHLTFNTACSEEINIGKAYSKETKSKIISSCYEEMKKHRDTADPYAISQWLQDVRINHRQDR